MRFGEAAKSYIKLPILGTENLILTISWLSLKGADI
jgi:hypothetical protein